MILRVGVLVHYLPSEYVLLHQIYQCHDKSHVSCCFQVRLCKSKVDTLRWYSWPFFRCHSNYLRFRNYTPLLL